MSLTLRNVPTRLATGAYVLHSGMEKWGGDPERAAALHATAAAAYPFLGRIAPERFLRLLAVAEIATGSLVLAPFVPARLAGAALTGFAGGLVGMYLRSPAMHRPGSVWPTPAGLGVSKDVWMLAIGLGLLADDPSRE